jgi:hypothetical protein
VFQFFIPDDAELLAPADLSTGAAV